MKKKIEKYLSKIYGDRYDVISITKNVAFEGHMTRFKIQDNSVDSWVEIDVANGETFYEINDSGDAYNECYDEDWYGNSYAKYLAKDLVEAIYK